MDSKIIDVLSVEDRFLKLENTIKRQDKTIKKLAYEAESLKISVETHRYMAESERDFIQADLRNGRDKTWRIKKEIEELGEGLPDEVSVKVRTEEIEAVNRRLDIHKNNISALNRRIDSIEVTGNRLNNEIVERIDSIEVASKPLSTPASKLKELGNHFNQEVVERVKEGESLDTKINNAMFGNNLPSGIRGLKGLSRDVSDLVVRANASSDRLLAVEEAIEKSCGGSSVDNKVDKKEESKDRVEALRIDIDKKINDLVFGYDCTSFTSMQGTNRDYRDVDGLGRNVWDLQYRADITKDRLLRIEKTLVEIEEEKYNNSPPVESKEEGKEEIDTVLYNGIKKALNDVLYPEPWKLEEGSLFV